MPWFLTEDHLFRVVWMHRVDWHVHIHHLPTDCLCEQWDLLGRQRRSVVVYVQLIRLRMHFFLSERLFLRWQMHFHPLQLHHRSGVDALSRMVVEGRGHGRVGGSTDDGIGYAPHRWILWYDGHGASSNGERAHKPTHGRIFQRKRKTEGWVNTSFLPICWDGLRMDGFLLGDGWIVHPHGYRLALSLWPCTDCWVVPYVSWVVCIPLSLPFPIGKCACGCGYPSISLGFSPSHPHPHRCIVRGCGSDPPPQLIPWGPLLPIPIHPLIPLGLTPTPRRGKVGPREIEREREREREREDVDGVGVGIEWCLPRIASHRIAR